MPRIARAAAIEIAIQILRTLANEDGEAAYVLAHRQSPEVLDQISEGLMLIAAACQLASESKVAEQ
jgi:hypothetical protein